MTEPIKTLAYVLVAALLGAAAFATTWTRSSGPGAAEFNDQGQLFFPNFKDPLACTSLEVIDYDPATASATPFQVMLKDGKWVIPSHHNYPADAKDHLARTAAGVMDLRKDTIRSDSKEDHELFGVIDPLDDKTTSLKGRGKRVTLRNQSGETLDDFIIGKEVRDRPDQRYVRVPGQTRTYGVTIKVDLSTRFADWIEPNLLKLDPAKIRRLVFDTNRANFDGRRVRIEPGEVLTIEKKDPGDSWTMAGLGPEQELNTEKITGATSALGDLKIVGVRRKPNDLARDLKNATSEEIAPTSDLSMLSLLSSGFYPTARGLLSTQGSVQVATDEGMVYTLRYGEATFATGEALSAGATKPDKGHPGGPAKEGSGGMGNRFLFVTAQFDPALIPQTAKTAAPPAIPAHPIQREAHDPRRAEEQKAAAEKVKHATEQRDRKIAEGKKRAKELTDRFADWYYVVPGDSLRTIRLDRGTLVRKKGSEPATGAGSSPAGSLPSAGLPPGMGR